MIREQTLWVAMVASGAVMLTVLTAEEPRLPLLAPGHTVAVEITLVPDDMRHLRCATAARAGDLHCAQRAPSEVGVASNPESDPHLLQPYTTVDRQQFLAAGVWAQPRVQEAARAAGSERFSVLCELRVTARASHAFVQWREGDVWEPVREWAIGSAESCAPP